MKTACLLVFSFLLLFMSSCGGTSQPQETPTAITPEGGGIMNNPEQTPEHPTPETESPTPSCTTGYVIPETMPFSEFEHSEYLLIISTNPNDASHMWDFFPYALLGDGIADINEGIAYYKALDAIYRKPIQSDVYKALNHLRGTDADARRDSPTEYELEHYSTCHVAFVSDDGKRVFCTSLYNVDSGVRILGEVYEGSEFLGKGFFAFETSQIAIGEAEQDVFRDLSGYIDEGIARPFWNTDWDTIDVGYISGYSFNPQMTMYVKDSPGETNSITLYSFPYNEIVHSFTLPPPSSSYGYTIRAFTADNRVILSEDGGYVYAICVDSKDIRILTEYSDGYSASVSPDGKYLAYKAPEPTINTPFNMPRGVFIQNLVTGDTISYEIYPADNIKAKFNIVGWARKSGVDMLIGTGKKQID